MININELASEFVLNAKTGYCKKERKAPNFRQLKKVEPGFSIARGWDYHFLYMNAATNCDSQSLVLNLLHVANWANTKETKLSKFIGDLGEDIPIQGNSPEVERYLRIYLGFGYVLKTLQEEGELSK
jgi:hypothetical protein